MRLILIPQLLGRGSMHVFSCEQFKKLMDASCFLGPWHSVIDLGAGDGATTAHVAHLFEKVYATDISAPMRWTLAKRKFTKNIQKIPTDILFAN
nr:PREDICTED: methyltransferase-like protein 9 isoform X2 [Megachile rotundata]